MKKIIFVLMFLLMFTACSSETEEAVVINEENISSMMATGLFDNCNELDDELLEINRFKLDSFEYLIIYSSESADDPSMFIIAEPAEGNYNDCKAQIEYYVENRFSAYLDYNPEAAKMIENKLTEDYGSYLVYIISEDNESAFNALKK